MKTYSIIIPVHNGIEYTKNCITTIISMLNDSEIDYKKVPIVLVDDGSTDGTGEWISKNYPFIHLLNGNGNLWWSGGINLGIRYGINKLKVDYVLLWNNDTTPANDYFKQVQNIINKDDNPAIICSVVYDKNQPDIILSTGSYFNSRTGTLKHNNYRVKESELTTEDFVINCFGGMGTLIRKDVFHKIGYFDEYNFPQYYGDTDFGLRASIADFKITLNPMLKIWNDKSNTGLHSKKGGIKELFDSYRSIRSLYNIKKDLKFYGIYSKSILAYKALLYKHLIFILSFCKRRLIALIR